MSSVAIGSHWTAPWGLFENATLLADSPGIWEVPDFMSDKEVAGVLSKLPPDDVRCPPGLPSSFDETCWGRCKGGAHSEQVGKWCSTLVRSQDTTGILDRIHQVWEGQGPQGMRRASVDVMRYTVGAEPTLVHRDTLKGEQAAASFAVYLTGTENNAGLVFPNAKNLSILPRRGAAVAWLNVHADGVVNHQALHGVDAAPKNATGDRIALFASSRFRPEVFIAPHANAGRRLSADCKSEVTYAENISSAGCKSVPCETCDCEFALVKSDAPILGAEYLTPVCNTVPAYTFMDARCNTVPALELNPILGAGYVTPSFARNKCTFFEAEHLSAIEAIHSSNIEFDGSNIAEHFARLEAAGKDLMRLEALEDDCSTAAGPSASATGDLHLHHAGGGRTDVKGIHAAVCNLHQASSASLNARFEYSSFLLSPEDPRSAEVLQVNGSFLTDAYATFETPLANGTSAALVRVEFGAQHPHKARMIVADAPTGAEIVDIWIGDRDGALVTGNVRVEVKKSPAPITLVMSNDAWQYTVTPSTHRNVADGARKTHIDVGVTALADPLASPVAPHGLLGQGFDLVHVDGKVDDYVPDAKGVFVTSAQGEGAIEGTLSDYVVDPEDPFSTQFKFGRFHSVKAPPRNISALGASEHPLLVSARR